MPKGGHRRGSCAAVGGERQGRSWQFLLAGCHPHSVSQQQLGSHLRAALRGLSYSTARRRCAQESSGHTRGTLKSTARRPGARRASVRSDCPQDPG